MNVIPRSVEACGKKLWTLTSWGREDGENPTSRPFRCRSWRHEGECRKECGACDFARVATAIHEHRFWTYCVFTYDRNSDPNTLFRKGKDHWSILLKRLKRKYKPLLYIQTWEIHKDEFPHINVVITSKRFWEAAKAEKDTETARFIQADVEAAGFGWKCYAKPILDKNGIASYLTKTALELTGSHFKDSDQTPVNAPPHFRRLRSSRGLLPKRFKDPTKTGQLFFLPLDYVNRSFNLPDHLTVRVEPGETSRLPGGLAYDVTGRSAESEDA